MWRGCENTLGLKIHEIIACDILVHHRCLDGRLQKTPFDLK
jgi:hypothetical protein